MTRLLVQDMDDAVRELNRNLIPYDIDDGGRIMIDNEADEAITLFEDAGIDFDII